MQLGVPWPSTPLLSTQRHHEKCAKCLWRHAAKRGLRGTLLQLRSLVLTHQGNDNPVISAFSTSRFQVSLESGTQLAGFVSLTQIPSTECFCNSSTLSLSAVFVSCCTIKCTVPPSHFYGCHCSRPTRVVARWNPFVPSCLSCSPAGLSTTTSPVPFPGPCFAIQLQIASGRAWQTVKRTSLVPCCRSPRKVWPTSA